MSRAQRKVAALMQLPINRHLLQDPHRRHLPHPQNLPPLLPPLQTHQQRPAPETDSPITWDVARATNYKTYRGMTSNPAAAVKIGQTSSLTYDDTTAPTGQMYCWFLHAVNVTNTSELSPLPSSGSRIFSAPTNLTATTMLRERVFLYWDMVPGLVSQYVHSLSLDH